MCRPFSHTSDLITVSSAQPMQGYTLLKLSFFGYGRDTKWSMGCWDEVNVSGMQSPGLLLRLENSESSGPQAGCGGEGWVRENISQEKHRDQFPLMGWPSEQPPPKPRPPLLPT